MGSQLVTTADFQATVAAERYDRVLRLFIATSDRTALRAAIPGTIESHAHWQFLGAVATI